MMPFKTLLTIGTLAVLLMPYGVVAYDPPNETLTNENVYEGFILPPNRRNVKAQTERQRQESAERRAAEQAAAGFGQGATDEDGNLEWADEEEETSDEEASMEDILKSLEESISAMNEQQDSTESKRDQRLLERMQLERDIQQLQLQFRGAAPLQSPLHGGAPLAGTGPATIAAAGCLAGAAWWTMRRAGKKLTRLR
jgi:hypothetical protein